MIVGYVREMTYSPLSLLNMGCLSVFCFWWVFFFCGNVVCRFIVPVLFS